MQPSTHITTSPRDGVFELPKIVHKNVGDRAHHYCDHNVWHDTCTLRETVYAVNWLEKNLVKPWFLLHRIQHTAASVNGKYAIVIIVSKRMFAFCSDASRASATDEAEKSYIIHDQSLQTSRIFDQFKWPTPSLKLCISCRLRSIRSRNVPNSSLYCLIIPSTILRSFDEPSDSLTELKISRIMRREPSMCSAKSRSDWSAQKYLLELVKFRSSKRIPCRVSLLKVMEPCYLVSKRQMRSI